MGDAAKVVQCPFKYLKYFEALSLSYHTPFRLSNHHNHWYHYRRLFGQDINQMDTIIDHWGNRLWKNDTAGIC